MAELFLILISTSLANNLVLDYMLGTDLIIAVTKNTTPAFDMCIAIIITMPLVAMSSYALNSIVIIPLGLEHLQLILIVILVSIVIQSVNFILRKYFLVLHERIGVLTPLIMVNCTVLGMAFLTTRLHVGIVGALFYGLGSAIGFSLILLAINSIREKVSVSNVPLPFRGVAILMITLGLVSMAFMGFNGINY
ncbi:MAG: electron transport complex protein RnfA [Gammaproteobacteria bacterium]